MCELQPSASRGTSFVKMETLALLLSAGKPSFAVLQGVCVVAGVCLCVFSCLEVRTKLFLCGSFLSSAQENSRFYLD